MKFIIILLSFLFGLVTFLISLVFSIQNNLWLDALVRSGKVFVLTMLLILLTFSLLQLLHRLNKKVKPASSSITRNPEEEEKETEEDGQPDARQFIPVNPIKYKEM